MGNLIRRERMRQHLNFYDRTVPAVVASSYKLLINPYIAGKSVFKHHSELSRVDLEVGDL